MAGARILEFPIIPDERGNLTFLQNNDQVPFKIVRSYWLYDVPGGQERGGHAFRESDEVIIALSGSFDLEVHSGQELEVFSLRRSYEGVFVPRMNWRRLTNFSTNSLALIISSTLYNSEDYIYDLDSFKAIRSANEVF